MKTFIIKSLLFVSPLLLLYITSLIFYSRYDGDLVRIGYLPTIGNYRSIFKSEFDQVISFDSFDSINKKNYDFLVVGDSFSGQGCYGYPNYLAKSGKALNVITLNRINVKSNPLEDLYGIINGDILNHINVKYIVLQSGERTIVTRGQNVCTKYKTYLKDLKQSIKEKSTKTESYHSFPPPELWKLPLYTLLYNYSDNAYFSEVYKVKTKKPLFSKNNANDLLFLKDDLENAVLNNNIKHIIKLNEELNKLHAILKKKNIELIVLPSPDKYDMFYEYISNKSQYPQPNFFNILKKLKKDYIYIDSKDVLSKHIKIKKDIYFYDDTHWSPWAAKIIAEEIVLATKFATNNHSDVYNILK